jgi:hypothetical protein
VRAHVRQGGYILHWMPMYAISRRSFDAAFRTFATEFPNASFWYVRGHGLFVAGLEPLQLDFATLAARFEHPAVRRDFESIGIRSPHELIGHLLMDDKQIARYLQSAAAVGQAVNTDDNAYLEYVTPYEFLQRTRTIIEALKPFAGWDRARLTGASPADAAAIDKASATRLGLLLDELDLPVE